MELGYTEQQLALMPGLLALMPADKQAEGRVLADRAKAFGLAMGSVNLLRSNGSRIPVEVCVIYDKDTATFECVSRDLSKRLRMEEQLRRHSERLKVQNRKVMAAVEDKDRFLRNVSHELRTPMTSIIGFSELLMDDTDEPLTPRQRMQLEKVAGSARKLLQMVNDLLDMSKVEAGRMPLEVSQVNIAGLLEQIIGDILPLAADKKLEMKVVVPSGSFRFGGHRQAEAQPDSC